jgi:hypothetical protein
MKKKYNLYILISLILFVLFIICHIYYVYQNKFETFSSPQIAFCLLTREPNILWFDFLTTFVNTYDVYVVIDKGESDSYVDIQRKYPQIKLVQINDDECLRANYINSDFLFKPIVATDRAFYYFNHINTKYEHIWFCEDDVFIHDTLDIQLLDRQHPSSDFIVSDIEITTDGNDSWPHWSNDDNKLLQLPWAHYLICLTRISKKLMMKVDDFVKTHKKLIYKEILFHTLALHNNMTIETPNCMSKIRYVPEWDVSDVINDLNENKKYIYHPIKNVQKHIELRTIK